jgi:hypothetical protein
MGHYYYSHYFWEYDIPFISINPIIFYMEIMGISWNILGSILDLCLYMDIMEYSINIRSIWEYNGSISISNYGI